MVRFGNTDRILRVLRDLCNTSYTAVGLIALAVIGIDVSVSRGQAPAPAPQKALASLSENSARAVEAKRRRDDGIADLAVPLTPVILNNVLPPASEDVSYGVTFQASAGRPPYSWLGDALPEWLTLTTTGQLSGTPPIGSAGSYNLTIFVTDSNQYHNGQILPLQVYPLALGILSQSPLGDAREQMSYEIAFQAQGGNHSYTWSASGLPAFLKLSSGGVLSGTPTIGSGGMYSFNIQVSDTTGHKASAPFALKIDPLIEITTPSPLPNATEQQAYSATFAANGGKMPYIWSATGLPPWATLSASGQLTGTPPAASAGSAAIGVTVSDSNGNSQTGSFPLLVLAQNNGLSVLAVSPLPGSSAGTYYKTTLSASGGTPPYAWTGSRVPQGLTLTSSGALEGIPLDGGSYALTAEVQDSKGNIAFATLSLNVTAPSLTIVTPEPLPEAQVGLPYSVTFQASGGTRPVSWSVSGTLPPGVTMDPFGNLSGTLTAPGDFNFTVSAASRGQSASANAVVVSLPAAPHLLVSAASLSFTAVTGSAAPPSQTVAVIASTFDPISFSAQPDVPWLAASPSGSTPGRVDVSVDPTGLPVGFYTGAIALSAPNLPSFTIQVSLSVGNGPVLIQAAPASLEIDTNGTSQSQVIHLTSTATSDVSFTAASDSPWLTVSPSSGRIAAGEDTTVVAMANPGILAAGAYLGHIEFDSAASAVITPVSLLVATQQKLVLGSNGILLEARQGNGVAGGPANSFTVLSAGSTSVQFTARQVGGADWLSLQTQGGTASQGAPATVSYQITSSALAQGTYYALIRLTSSQVFNSPEDFEVVLNVLGPQTAPPLDPEPAGLVFVASGAATPGSRNVTIGASSDQPVSFQTAVNTQNGGAWLQVTPASGKTSTGQPAQLTVSASAQNLPAGIYQGSINISLSNLAVRTESVTLIVSGSTAPSVPSARRPHAESNCTPSKLVITSTSLGGNFLTPAAWPQPLLAQLDDDCGSAVTDGNVVAEFSNGDPSLRLILIDSASATYSATWTPDQAVTQMRVTLLASATGLQSASAPLTGAVSQTVAPILMNNAVVHNFYPQPGAPLAPGTVVEIYGSALAVGSTTSGIPLATTLNGTSVFVGGELAPLFYASDNQIGAQLPADLVAGQQYQILVSVANAYSTPIPIDIEPVTPGVETSANGFAVAQHRNGSMVTPESPAQPGENLTVFLEGMGATNPAVTAGIQAPASPASSASTAPAVTIGGKPVAISSAGLVPGFVGLYQVNFQLPAGLPAGKSLLEISQSGTAANTSLVPVAQ